MSTRRSVHVGLNYPATPSALSGCWNDAYDWRDAAIGRHFLPLVITDQLPSSGTKAHVRDTVRTELGRCKPGDHFLLTLSTHGTYRPDRNGDEVDGRDEAVCLADFADGGLWVDDEIEADLALRKPMVKVTVIFDLCHSGTAYRAVHRGEPVNPHVGGSPRFLPPVEFMDGREVEAAKAAADMPLRGFRRAGAVSFSACRDDQVAWDARINGRYNGAFSWAMLKALSGVGNHVEWVQRAMGLNRFDQEFQARFGPWQRTRRPLR